jgi:hypothetical protein
MTDVEALIRFSEGQQPSQAIIAHLVNAGFVTAADGTNFDSDEKELLLTSITEKGRKHLEDALKVLGRHISDLEAKSPRDKQKIESLTIARHRIEAALSRDTLHLQ